MSQTSAKAESAKSKKPAARAAASAPKESGAKELSKLAKTVGNDRVADLLKGATKQRDSLLAHILERLASVKGAQSAEVRAMADQRVWFDEVAHGKTGFALPDATRWREPALLYRRAADALCAGDLGRGADLVRKAADAEAAAFAALPGQVQLPESERQAARSPAEADRATDGATCPATHAPAVMRLADAIVRTADRAPKVSNPPKPSRHGWWGADEAEDEKKVAAKEPAKAATAPTAAVEAPDKAADSKKKAASDAAEKAAAKKPSAERVAEVAPATKKSAANAKTPETDAQRSARAEQAARGAEKARAAAAAKEMADAHAAPEKAAQEKPEEEASLQAAKANAEVAQAKAPAKAKQ